MLLVVVLGVEELRLHYCTIFVYMQIPLAHGVLDPFFFTDFIFTVIATEILS